MDVLIRHFKRIDLLILFPESRTGVQKCTREFFVHDPYEPIICRKGGGPVTTGPIISGFDIGPDPISMYHYYTCLLLYYHLLDVEAIILDITVYIVYILIKEYHSSLLKFNLLIYIP